jgi:hypothetical protein
MGKVSWLLVVAALAMVLITPCTQAIEEVPFATLDPAQRNQVVLMYKSGDDANEQALEAVLYAEMNVQEAVELGGMVSTHQSRAHETEREPAVLSAMC